MTKQCASDRIRAAAKKLGYVAPLTVSEVPMEVRTRLAEQLGVTRQAVANALSKEVGARRGPRALASQGKVRKTLEAAKVVRWLRALAAAYPDREAVFVEVAEAIRRGHVDAWTDPFSGAALARK